MAILPSDIKIYLSQGNPEDDSTVTGGDIAATSGAALKVSFKDLSGTDTVQVISSYHSDGVPIVITGRDSGGAIVSETETLTGMAPATTTQTFERFLKVLKSATTIGDVAIERTTKEKVGTVQDGAAATSIRMAYVSLDSASSGNNDWYNNHVVRIDAGTGSGQIREIVDYDGASRRAYVSRDWDTVPTSGAHFVVSQGIVLDKWPTEVSGARRMFYAAESNAAGGADKGVVEKLFVKNTHSTLTLTNAKIQLTADGSTNDILKIALESGLQLNQSATNRLTPPSQVTDTYSTSLKTVPGGGNLPANSYIGVWVSGALDDGLSPEKFNFTITTTGSST